MHDSTGHAIMDKWPIWSQNLHIMQFWVMFCMCAPQYSEFCGKPFWALLCPSNVMCYMHCTMVLVMVSPPNRWYIIKISMCHWWVSITGNTWVFDISSFDPHFVHIGKPPENSGNCYDSWNIHCGWINHLQCWFTQSGPYQMPQTEYWNSDFRSWIYMKNWSWWHTICHIMAWFQLSHFW